MTLAQIIVTTGGLVIQGAASIELRTPFTQPLPLSGPVEQSPFMLAGAAWLSMDRAPLQHTAGYTGDVVIPPSAFRQGRSVEVVVDGVVAATLTGYDWVDLNLDGFRDAADADRMTTLWLNGDQRADVNNDLFVDALDWDSWWNAYLMGT